MNRINFIEALSNANGISGFEDEVLDVIRVYAGEKFKISEDKMRNLVIYQDSHDETKPSIMLDGHSDEVGFMVQSIQQNGLIRFLAIGGWFSQNVNAHKVRIRNSEGKYITGIVASKPPHFMTPSERTTIVQIEDMLIDVGSTSYEETINLFKIEAGAPIVPDVAFEYKSESGIMIGKAFDNRLGCALVLEVMKSLEGLDLPFNVVGAISSQEEIGTRGSVLTSRKINPQVSIVFEGTPADDSHRGPYEAQGVVKKGTQIRHRDNSMIGNPRFIKFARDIAKSKGHKFQDAIRKGGGTDAGKVHLNAEGVPTLVFGVPVRYAHTHYGISSLEDFNTTVAFACDIIKDLSIDLYNSL